MKIERYKWSLLLTFIFLASLTQLFVNTKVITDISSFIPSGKSEKQKFLFEELKQGVSGKLWLLAIEGGDADSLVSKNQRLVSRLNKSQLFSSISNGGIVEHDDSLALLMKYRFLLHESTELSESTLRTALNERINDLASPLSSFNKEQIVSDPVAYTSQLLSKVYSFKGQLNKYKGVWFSENKKKTFLIAESKADGLDMDAQQQIKQEIIDSFNLANSDQKAHLRMTGSPYIGLMTRDKIQNDSRMLSIVASIFLAVVLIVVFRHPGILIFSAIPIVTGIAISAAITSLVFGSIHGITLAFGVTLLGIALDYPVHIVSHRTQSQNLHASIKSIWPIMRLGALTTSMGYAAMIFARFDGLVQLGVFSVAGLLVSVVVSRFVLPELEMLVQTKKATSILPSSWLLSYQVPGTSAIALFVILASVITFIYSTPILSDNISELSPVPISLKKDIKEFRRDVGIAEPRYAIFVRGNNLEDVLRTQEEFASEFNRLVKNEYLQSLSYAARLLPSRRTQQQRQKSLPESVRLQKNLSRAMVGTPFRPGTFKPFIRDVENSRTLTPLTFDELKFVLVGKPLSSLLRQNKNSALGIIRLTGVSHPEKIENAIINMHNSNIWFVDIKKSAGENIKEFSFDVLTSIGWALLIILIVLITSIRDIKKTASIAIPVLLSILLAASIPLALGQTLNLFNLVSLLLVAGIGIDYALFFSRDFINRSELESTFQSLLVCSVSTIGVFAIISFSKVPVLNSIGITVAGGVCAAFIFSWIFSRSPVES